MQVAGHWACARHVIRQGPARLAAAQGHKPRSAGRRTLRTVRGVKDGQDQATFARSADPGQEDRVQVLQVGRGSGQISRCRDPAGQTLRAGMGIAAAFAPAKISCSKAACQGKLLRLAFRRCQTVRETRRYQRQADNGQKHRLPKCLDPETQHAPADIPLAVPPSTGPIVETSRRLRRDRNGERLMQSTIAFESPE